MKTVREIVIAEMESNGLTILSNGLGCTCQINDPDFLCCEGTDCTLCSEEERQ